MKDKRSVKERLNEQGFIVGERRLNKATRLITDKKGNSYGYLQPLDALKLLKE